MSADKFVPTRVRAAVQTWASSIRTWNRNSNVDVEIFAQSNTTVGVPIVKMPGVSDNIYPPQKKSFSMMRYVSDHHGSDYEWFLRLYDDAYVHIEHLESFLRRIDSSQPLYISSPGFGRDDDVFVEDNMVYCMGGPGIVLSKTTLASLSPKLGEDHYFRFHKFIQFLSLRLKWPISKYPLLSETSQRPVISSSCRPLSD